MHDRRADAAVAIGDRERDRVCAGVVGHEAEIRSAAVRDDLAVVGVDVPCQGMRIEGARIGKRAGQANRIFDVHILVRTCIGSCATLTTVSVVGARSRRAPVRRRLSVEPSRNWDRCLAEEITGYLP